MRRFFFCFGSIGLSKKYILLDATERNGSSKDCFVSWIHGRWDAWCRRSIQYNTFSMYRPQRASTRFLAAYFIGYLASRRALEYILLSEKRRKSVFGFKKRWKFLRKRTNDRRKVLYFFFLWPAISDDESPIEVKALPFRFRSFFSFFSFFF